MSRGDHAWEDSGGEWQGMKNTLHSIAMCQSGLRRVLSTKAKSVRWNRGEKKREKEKGKKREKERKKEEKEEEGKGGQEKRKEKEKEKGKKREKERKRKKRKRRKRRRRPVDLLPISGIW